MVMYFIPWESRVKQCSKGGGGAGACLLCSSDRHSALQMNRSFQAPSHRRSDHIDHNLQGEGGILTDFLVLVQVWSAIGEQTCVRPIRPSDLCCDWLQQ